MPKLGSRAAARKAAVAAKKSRKDPARRHVDGSANWTRLENRREDMHYVLAYNGHAETGVEYYQDLGYDVVESSDEEGAVRLGAGSKRVRKPGQPIEMRGHTLMAIPKEDHDELVAHGEDGHTGQELFDDIESRIVKQGAADSLRGHLAPHLSIESDTTALQVEEG